MNTTYRHDDLLDRFLSSFIANLPEFGNLLECKTRLLGCFCERTDKDGQPAPPKDRSEPVKLKKVSPLHQAFIDADFLVIIEQWDWDNAENDEDRERIVHKVLTNAVAETGEDDEGNLFVKHSIKDYDYKFNRQSYARYKRLVCDCLDEKGALTRTIVKDIARENEEKDVVSMTVVKKHSVQHIVREDDEDEQQVPRRKPAHELVPEE